MLSENQSNMLKSLNDRRLDLNDLIVSHLNKVQEFKEELKLVDSAIINLETENKIE